MKLDQKVKKDPEGNFLFLPSESPKMPKSIKREVTRKEIRKKDTRAIKFSKFQCKICEKYFSGTHALNQHVELHFQPSSFECKKCERVFELKKRFVNHKCVKKSERHFCTFCEKNFAYENSLKQHLKNFHADKFQADFHCCHFCDKTYIQKHKLKAHLESFQCRRIFTCDHCGKKVDDKKKIYQHVKIHAIHKVECKICQAQVKLTSLRDHMRIMHESEKVECKICKKVFKNSHLLKNHFLFHELKKFGCQICKLIFSTRGNFNQHMKFHENPEQFKCQICGHQTKEKKVLKKHLRTHDKNREKNLKCNQCNFKTDNKYYLSSHLKSHEKSKRKLIFFPNAIKCEKCPSVLINKKYHQTHLWRKHGNRPKLQCDACGLEFAQKDSFKKHFALKH
jgi:KRAB domain-containing zinc finger protein